MTNRLQKCCIKVAPLALALPLLGLVLPLQAHAPDRAKVAPLFPGATLTHKLVPLDAAALKHLNNGSAVKFTGSEAKWHIYNATKNGQRVGMGALTHATLPGGAPLDIAFAVDTKFKVTRVRVVNAPAHVKAKLVQFTGQFTGKGASSALKAGKDLKAPPGLSLQSAQVAADAVHKGLLLMDEYFNAAHAD